MTMRVVIGGEAVTVPREVQLAGAQAIEAWMRARRQAQGSRSGDAGHQGGQEQMCDPDTGDGALVTELRETEAAPDTGGGEG